MSKRATITDVAEKAGVSVATVSRLFAENGYPVSSDTARKIRKAADELDYTPNIVGRMLKTNTSRDIGVIIPTIMNPFYPDVLLGIEKTAASRGYQILLCNSLRDQETESMYIESLYQKQVRGIIIAGTRENLSIAKLSERGMHLVNLEPGSECMNCLGIEFDFRRAGVMMAEHFYNLGHRNITFVSSPMTKKSRREILEGIRTVYKDELNVILDEKETEDESGSYEYEMGKRMACRILEKRSNITGIIAVNDMAGAGIIKVLTEEGIDIPGEISVAGFDNIALSSMISPSLTTVDQPGFRTGQVAAEMIIDMIEGNELMEYELEPRLIVRESTAKTGG